MLSETKLQAIRRNLGTDTRKEWQIWTGDHRLQRSSTEEDHSDKNPHTDSNKASVRRFALQTNTLILEESGLTHSNSQHESKNT